MSNMIERPLELPHLTLKNRVIRSAVHSFLAGRDGYMTEAEYKKIGRASCRERV